MNAADPIACITSLIRFVGSASGGELTNARDALVRALKAFNLDFHAISDLVEGHISEKIKIVEIIDIRLTGETC